MTGRFVVSGLLTLPLVADLVARALGFQVFYLADLKLQLVWGALVQLGAAWPLYGDAWRHGGRPRVIALLSLAFFGYNLAGTFGSHHLPVHYLTSAGLVTLGYGWDLLRRHRPR